MNNIFLSSNTRKIQQIRDMIAHIPGLTMGFRAGNDEREIDGPDYLVPIYKALNNNVGDIIDDTQLIVVDRPDWNPIYIKWNEEHLIADPTCAGSEVIERVWLAQKTNTHINLYLGEQRGTWRVPTRRDAFGYNGGFVPHGEDRDLDQIIRSGNYFNHSSRFRALTNLAKQQTSLSIPIADLPPWTGAWQT